MPDSAGLLAGPGSELLIRLLPGLLAPTTVRVEAGYGSHREAWAAAGHHLVEGAAAVVVAGHPDNPGGGWWSGQEGQVLTVLDEAYCELDPARSRIAEAARLVVLRSFGKFHGWAGLRLGFIAGPPRLIGSLRQRIGAWPVSGAAIAIGRAALADEAWAAATRLRLAGAARMLHALIGPGVVGGTDLYRLVERPGLFERLAAHGIYTRRFGARLRIGLPGPPEDWQRLIRALT
ncbi:MAG: threonine-phosphate decarboxylase CobD [Thalassobaculales bacterium]